MAIIKIHVFHTGEVCVAPDLPFGGDNSNAIKAWREKPRRNFVRRKETIAARRSKSEKQRSSVNRNFETSKTLETYGFQGFFFRCLD